MVQAVVGVVFQAGHQLAVGQIPFFVYLPGIGAVGMIGIKHRPPGPAHMRIIRRFQLDAAVLIIGGGVVVIQGGLAGAVLDLAEAHRQHFLAVVPIPIINIIHAPAIARFHAVDDLFLADHGQRIGARSYHQRIFRVRDHCPIGALLVSHREFVFIEAFSQFHIGFPNSAAVRLHRRLAPGPAIPCAWNQHLGRLRIRVGEMNPAWFRRSFQSAIFQRKEVIGIRSRHAVQQSIFPICESVPVGIGIPKALHAESLVRGVAALRDVEFRSAYLV